MSRIGLIVDNSADCVKIVINAWNNGDCVVLNDTHFLYANADREDDKIMLKKIVEKLKNRSNQSLKSTFKATKYMMRIVWNIPEGKKYIFLNSFISILTAVLPLVLVCMPGLIINELTGERRTDVLLMYIGITVGIPFIQGVVISSLNVYLNNLRYNFMVRVKVDYINHCADMDLESMENPDIQILRERAEETTSESLSTFEHLSGLASAIISVVMCVSIISVLNPWLLALVIVVVIINYTNSKWLEKKSYEMNFEIGKLNRFGWPVMNYLSDLRYAKEVRLYHLKDYFIKLYRDKRIEAGEYGKKTSAYMAKNGLIGSTVALIQNVLLYGYFVYQVIIGALAVGDMTIYMGAISQFTSSLGNVMRQYLNLSMLSLRVQELMRFMEIPLKNLHSGSDTPKFDSDSVIEFKNVSFKYPGADSEALRDINFHARRGQTVAIIGSTGCGKSTLVNLIPRFYDACEGQVLVDGVDVRDYTQYALRCKIGYVSQKAVLFSGTVESNIAYGDCGKGKISRSDVEDAVYTAQASEFVEGLSAGYEGYVAQAGSNFSGGQKQRLSIARAVARYPEILIFDDSFSALDYKTDRKLREALKSCCSDATKIIVAQRIGTIRDADMIIVLDEGRMAGIGTHESLMQECEVYRQIAYSQLSKEELG